MDDYQYYGEREYDMCLQEMEYNQSPRSSGNHGFPSVKLLRRRFNSPVASEVHRPTRSRVRDNVSVAGYTPYRSVSQSPHRGEKRTRWNQADGFEYSDRSNDYQQTGVGNWQYSDQGNTYLQDQDQRNWYGGEDYQDNYRYNPYNYNAESYHRGSADQGREKTGLFQQPFSLGDIKMLDPEQQGAEEYQDEYEYGNHGDDDGRLDCTNDALPSYYSDVYEHKRSHSHDESQEEYKSSNSRGTGRNDAVYQSDEREFKSKSMRNYGEINSMNERIEGNVSYDNQCVDKQRQDCRGRQELHSRDTRKPSIRTSKDVLGNKINIIRHQTTSNGERRDVVEHSDQTYPNITHDRDGGRKEEGENMVRHQKKRSTTPRNDRININNSRDSRTALVNDDNKCSQESEGAAAGGNPTGSDETSDESRSKWDHISEDVQLWKRQISPEENHGGREEVISSDSSESMSNKRSSCIKNKRKVGKSQSVHWENQYNPREDKTTRNKVCEPNEEKRRNSHKDKKTRKARVDGTSSRDCEKDFSDLHRSSDSPRKSPRTKQKIDKKKQKLIELKRRLSLHYGADLEVIEMLLSKDRHVAKDLLELKELKSHRKPLKHTAREIDYSEDETDSASTRSIAKPSTPAIVVDGISEIFEAKQKNQNARTRETSHSTLTDCHDGYWLDNAGCNNVWCPEQAIQGRLKASGTTDKSGHFLQMGKYMRNLHQNQQLLDVKIVIGDQTFLAHRIALSCHSEYFADLFSKQCVAKRKYPLEIHIKGVTALAFRVFLEYVYTGEIRRPPQDGALCEMMMAADKLLIPYLRERCGEFALDASPEEGLLLLKRSSRDSGMFQIAYDIVLRNMQDLLCSKTFLQLDLETVCDLLSDNSLSISSEVLVFGLAVRWMEYAKCERYKYAPRLIECVRLSLMNNKELVHCADSSPLFRDYPICRDKLLRANWISTCRALKISDPLLLNRAQQRTACSGSCQSRPESRIGSPPRSTHPSRPPSVYGGKTPESTYTREPSREDFSSSRRTKVDDFQPCQYAEISEPRTSYSSKRTTSSEGMEVIIPEESNGSRDSLKRGRSQKSTTSASQYGGDYKQSRSAHSQQQQQQPPSFIPGVIGGAAKSYQATPLISNEILAIGGSCKETIKGGLGVQHYSTSKNQWTHYCNLPEPRQNHATALLGDKLYLTGGRSAKKKNSYATNSVFVFDMENKSWETMPSMKDSRMNHALCPMFGLLYAIGGQNEKGTLLKSMECYNPHTDAWDYVHPMSEAREGVAATVFQDKLFVAGGYGPAPDKKIGKPVLGLIECFDPRQNKWSKKDDLRIPRCHGNLMVGAGKMFMFGGATRSLGTKEQDLVSLSSVDVYLPGTDGWKYVTDLVTARHSAGAVTLVNKIYIIGGISSANDRVLKSVECFDADSGSWVSDIQDLVYPTKSLGCSIAPLSLPKKAT